jgi:MFS family permease
MMGAVLALGLTQITVWGTSYYCLGVLADPISQDTGWSRGFVFLGFTVAVLAMGLVSNAVGRAIDRRGARAVMTLGTVLVSAGLFALAQVRSEAMYLIAWTFLGVGMRLCLYDAAFAALVQVAPSRGRMAISYLTLFGAFASSVFWVVGHALNERLGWRQTPSPSPSSIWWFARRCTGSGSAGGSTEARARKAALSRRRTGRRWKARHGSWPSRFSPSSCP